MRFLSGSSRGELSDCRKHTIRHRSSQTRDATSGRKPPRQWPPEKRRLQEPSNGHSNQPSPKAWQRLFPAWLSASIFDSFNFPIKRESHRASQNNFHCEDLTAKLLRTQNETELPVKIYGDFCGA
jgi:hypothetical protein